MIQHWATAVFMLFLISVEHTQTDCCNLPMLLPNGINCDPADYWAKQQMLDGDGNNLMGPPNNSTHNGFIKVNSTEAEIFIYSIPFHIQYTNFQPALYHYSVGRIFKWTMVNFSPFAWTLSTLPFVQWCESHYLSDFKRCSTTYQSSVCVHQLSNLY